MAKVAFILLCHKDPDAIVQQAQQLTAAGDYIAIHFDANAPQVAFDTIRAELADNPNVVYAVRRIKCGWGTWSLVQATLYAVQAVVDAFPRATHFYMVSGDCMPVKSARYVHDFLDDNDADFIESFDYFSSGWIKTGFQDERLIYRHYFNERTQKWLFYTSFHAQRRLGLTRAVPADMQIMIGSQWWCLRRRTIEWLLEFTKTRKDVMRFFRTTWIPDETFFQTLVRHLVPGDEIRSQTLTFLMFSDYGMPVSFYNDHYDLLLAQNALFARKISPEAKTLKKRLGDLYAGDQVDFDISDEGRNLFRYLAGRGRVGRRFAPQFWEAGTSLGRDRELLMIVCKKWHVAKRLVAAIRQHTDIPAMDYLFNEADAHMPDLGGVESTLGKRTRHRRAVMRMLFEHDRTDRMVICLDTGSIDLMQDFYADKCTTRLLEIECSFADDYLIGHARRVGLAGDQTSSDTLAHLIPTIRQDMQYERDVLRDAGFAHYHRLRETGTLDENTAALVRFLRVPEPLARTLAETPHLFVD